jgi:hypothetical protein
MVATTMNICNAKFVISPLPATQALEHAKRRPVIAREGQRASILADKLANDLFVLHMDEEIDSFPSIEWESGDESDSDSLPSMDSWSSFLHNSDSSNSLGKRSRGNNSRRLVRSKKIKSNLSSLGLGLSA